MQDHEPSMPTYEASAIALAIDFILNSSPMRMGLQRIVQCFPGLLSGVDDNGRQLIQNLPITDELNSLYAIDARQATDDTGRSLYRYSERGASTRERPTSVDLVQVPLTGEHPYTVEVQSYRFRENSSGAVQLIVDVSEDAQRWGNLCALDVAGVDEPITQRAVRLFYALLAIHQYATGEDGEDTYVPFKPQLFCRTEGATLTLHLLADRVPRKLLGTSAWYHDQDDRITSVMVPKERADLWRVGWAVADVLGVAADMSGETGERDEQLGDLGVSHGEQGTDDSLTAHAEKELEGYVLRQQLRKLQGTYLSEARVETDRLTSRDLPATVRRALELLRTYPSNQNLHTQVRHLLLIEAESRAMALRLQRRSADDLRHTLHRVFPDVLARLPLWSLQGLKLERPSGHKKPLRPELALMVSLYGAMYSASASLPSDVVDKDSFLRVALTLAAVGIGLRGCVAALWGASVASGSPPMAEHLNVPANWATPDAIRLDPQGDYKAMRKRLLEGDWTALCKASPWQWMLALLGLLDAGHAKAFDPTVAGAKLLKNVYLFLCAWQTESGSLEDAAHVEESEQRWPFDALPRFTPERCDALMQELPIALSALDELCGLRVVRVEAPAFGRSRSTTEFIDAGGATWQLTKPQFTSLYDNTVEQYRPKHGSRILRVWTETRRISDNDLLAVHTLDSKLGAWFQRASAQVDDSEVIKADLVKPDADEERFVPMEAETASDDDMPAVSLPLMAGKALGAPVNRGSTPVLFDRLREGQQASWKQRFRGDGTSAENMAKDSSHFRVALLQWQVTDSYAHPIAEAGLNGLPLGKSSQEELCKHLAGNFRDLNKAAKRGAEFHLQNEESVISWPEHRRRVFLREALRACQYLSVQLLILPEVSVRPDTVAWLKKELRQHPDLAVLAGTYRHFGDKLDAEHLMEKLTLLWQPNDELAKALGVKGSSEVFQFQRGKKYRAVAAHELFRPEVTTLKPLFTEDGLLDALESKRKGSWSSSDLKALIPELIHAPNKLRYCMELICSELFLLTSPANRIPLQQELAKVLKHFSHDPRIAKDLVDNDFKSLGQLLTVAQSKRERRSVLLVPACTTRSNDYWHAGQASVLASGTATVFCNTSNLHGAGGSCFIGIDSVVQQNGHHAGIVHLLTPYHGWHKGILQPNGGGALSKTDQALVVVDLDPVHVVSGKPRPQLLPEPMSLVAYLPIVEVVNQQENAEHLSTALRKVLTPEGQNMLCSLLKDKTLPAPCGPLHEYGAFCQALEELLEAKKNGKLKPDIGGEALDAFAALFSDASAVRERIMAWLKDHHQQPAPKAGKERLEPAWLDFLVVDLTWDAHADYAPSIHVPTWLG